MAVVTLDRVSKVYQAGQHPAVDDVSVEIRDGEFMVLLGPSGCGKSTTLRMVAGLETISSGELSIDGQLMNAVAAKNRDIAMVFQSYALYPHMSVRDNLAFGLRRRGFDKPGIARRVGEVAASIGLTDYLARRPHALSGGQRQRVALGRAIVRDPKVFLFDEPLSNLDAALRVSTRAELIKLHERLAATILYVTHDQVEAMTMGSRICIMKDGRVSQIGAPMDVYLNPADTFVASFLGNPPMNLVPATVGDAGIAVGGGTVAMAALMQAGDPVTFGIRPEDLELGPVDAPDASMSGVVTAIEPLGAETLILVRLGDAGSEITVRADRNVALRPGEPVGLGVNHAAVRLFDPTSGKALPISEETGS